jgi:hypothetical protein
MARAPTSHGLSKRKFIPGKNETPKSGLGDQGPEWRFCSPIPDTETKPYPPKMPR